MSGQTDTGISWPCHKLDRKGGVSRTGTMTLDIMDVVFWAGEGGCLRGNGVRVTLN